ncbi:MAG: YkgJ family cysteine cluster protein [Phycisphaerae bacterium]
MGGILCEHCTALCCRYIALPIDTPETRKDFDDIRWYLLHEGVHVFVEDGDWYITMQTNCRHLQPDYRCGIYDTRPQICRDYTTANCDYHSGDYGWEQHFSAPAHLDDYLRLHPPKQPRKRRRAHRAPAANGRSVSGGAANGKKRATATAGRGANGVTPNGRPRADRAPGAANTRRGRHTHSTLRARLGKRRTFHAPRRRAPIDYAAATVDTRGVPLPVLNLPIVGGARK